MATSPLYIIIFIAGTLVISVISRKSLLKLQSHGFYRFFAWEILLGMFLLNVDSWFSDPFALHQLISWALLIASIALVALGLRFLREVGNLDAGQRDASLLGLEKTTRLVTIGLYRYLRHPLYSSLLFLGWGMFFKSPSWLDAGLALLCTAFLFATARVEERENVNYFGVQYVEYIRHSKMFIPFVF
jgi:protein-S-isoprenylcysteine O-methyltransferase Ste14